MKMLSDLFADLGGIGGLQVAGLTADSRKVRPGFVFVAIKGTVLDGADFIESAVEKGAIAIVADKRPVNLERAGDVPVISVQEPRKTFAKMLARFHASQPECIVAVTGTNGKTSVAHFVRAIWEALGHRSASMGTLGTVTSDGVDDLGHTTPDPELLYAKLAELANEGVTHVALEASSHGLDQFRLDGVKVSAAALTNITRDHMDYHKDFDAYAYAKLRLFGEVMGPRGNAVLNESTELFIEAEALCWGRGHEIITIGDSEETINLVRQVPTSTGQNITVEVDGARYDVSLPLSGDFQAMNVLVAAGLVMATGTPVADVMATLDKLPGVPGRLELIGTTKTGGAVLVDYAHTPDALKTVLMAIRPHATGKLYVAYGCGGDRDAGKRPLMAEMAAAHADVAILTDDNPRSEDPAEIRAQALKGGDAIEIGDRADAIRFGIEKLQDGDLFVIAGKGHETGQTVGEKVLPFDDRLIAAQILTEMNGKVMR